MIAEPAHVQLVCFDMSTFISCLFSIFKFILAMVLKELFKMFFLAKAISKEKHLFADASNHEINPDKWDRNEH